MIIIERDDDSGYWRIIEDGVGIAKSKSRNCCIRIRDALNAIGNVSLIGSTVRPMDSELNASGVVLAVSDKGLIVRLNNGFLDLWDIIGSQIIEPEYPDKETTFNDPAIGVLSAVELLQRFLSVANTLNEHDLADLVENTTTFLSQRESAEPIP